MNFLRSALRLPGVLVVFVLTVLIRVYQRLISPLLGPHCRFEPSCSQYFILALRKYGALRGSIKGIWRILRCNPWFPGGHDPP